MHVADAQKYVAGDDVEITANAVDLGIDYPVAVFPADAVGSAFAHLQLSYSLPLKLAD